MVVQYRDDQARVGPLPVVLRGGDQLGEAVHLHGAIADDRDGGPVGTGELGADHVGHARAHRRQRPRQRAAHVAAHPQVPGVPVRG